MSELEDLTKAPTMPAENLLGLVANLSSSSVDAPRQIPHALADQLRVIADRHGGEVPLHGRLFAQWLHNAFPHECPYPQILESAAKLLPDEWSRDTGSASREEAELHIQATKDVDVVEGWPTEVGSDWSDEEFVPFYYSESPKIGRGTVGKVTHFAMYFVAFAVALRAALSAWPRAAIAHGCGGGFLKKGGGDESVSSCSV